MDLIWVLVLDSVCFWWSVAVLSHSRNFYYKINLYPICLHQSTILLNTVCLQCSNFYPAFSSQKLSKFFRVIKSFRQMVGIPMGTNCAPLLADLFLYSYENEFLDKLIKEGKRKLARRFNLSYRYIDDLISFNNKRFKEFISDIYPKELTTSETTESTSVASYLDLLFTRDRSNNITTKLYDKRDAFGFHIVNFPFMSSNIPSAPAYGVYASQLVRYARCCSNYSDFLIRHRALVKRLLSQGYKVNRLSNTFKKFYGRHTDLVGQYKKNVCQMFADSIS